MINPVKSLFATREARTGTSGGLAWPSDDLISSLQQGPTIAGETIDTTTAMRIADVFTAVNVIAEEIGGLPLKVYRSIGDDTLEASDHRAYRMLHDRPNPSMPAHRFWSVVAVHLLLWGNAYIEKLRDANGLVSELWILHPSWVTVQWSYVERKKRFIVYWPYMEKVILEDDRVLHLFGVSQDGLVGMSPIAQCRQSLGIAAARDRFEGDVYNEKPFVSGAIQHPGQVKDTVKLRESWQTIYGGKGPARHGVAVLEEGATFQPFSMPLSDMQFVEAAQLSKTTIANIFKLPPAYLGGSVGTHLTYQTVEGNEVAYTRRAIRPVTQCIESFVNGDSGIFPFPSWYSEFKLEGLMRGDSKARSDYYVAMNGIGALTVDEIREIENLPPLAVEAEETAEESALEATLSDEGDTLPPMAAQPAPPNAPVGEAMTQ